MWPGKKGGRWSGGKFSSILLSLVRRVAVGQEENLVVFYYLSASKMWSDKDVGRLV